MPNFTALDMSFPEVATLVAAMVQAPSSQSKARDSGRARRAPTTTIMPPDKQSMSEQSSKPMKDSKRKAWTDFVRKREQASKGKKRERRSEQTPETRGEDALDKLLHRHRR